ncbi:MAG: protein kinase, partial [Planctomycetota bacterium]
MKDDLAQTIEYIPSANEKPKWPSKLRAQIQVNSKSPQADFLNRFDESTRVLLQQRLFTASCTLLCMMAVVKILVFIYGGLDVWQFSTRLLSISVLSATALYLKRNPEAPLITLRAIEIVVLAVPLIEAIAVQLIETQELFVSGNFDEIPALHATLGTAVAIFISIYGLFIPSPWQRTAVITGTMAILPPLVTLFQMRVEPMLAIPELPILINAVLLVMMACVATLGSSVVHSIRREVESARQYGQYQLIEEIGRGGMGVVYKARHKMLKRPAAVKLIMEDAAHDETTIERFEREVQFSATLSHWNTVQIYDYGLTLRGEFFYVMEYLKGQSLAQRIRSSGKLPLAESVKIALQICDG